MPNDKIIKNSFPTALRVARVSRNLSQEAFSLVSSRTYVSSLERGIKSPTLSKVDELAAAIGIHPLTLLTLAYMQSVEQNAIAPLLTKVSEELSEIFDPCGAE